MREIGTKTESQYSVYGSSRNYITLFVDFSQVAVAEAEVATIP